MSPLDQGSMRGVIIMWIGMTISIGNLTVPKYVMIFGAITGIILIILSALVNYWAFSATLKSTFYTGKM